MAITEITRVAIIDYIMDGLGRWTGRLEEDAFLSRLYPLHQMPSRDRRFQDAAGDIWQHRVMNAEDWDDDWVFHDSRFESHDPVAGDVGASSIASGGVGDGEPKG